MKPAAILLAIAAAIAALWKTIKRPEAMNTASTGANAAAKAPRGIRNNNAGNIRHGQDRWQGMSQTQTDSAFIQFEEPVWGLRAMAKLLINYEKLHRLTTLREVVSRWAPNNENNTGAYVQSVASKTGINESEPLNLSTDSGRLMSLMAAMIHHENGQQPYNEALIYQAIRKAKA